MTLLSTLNVNGLVVKSINKNVSTNFLSPRINNESQFFALVYDQYHFNRHIIKYRRVSYILYYDFKCVAFVYNQ